MVTISELKKIVILGYLTDEMLEKLVPITDLLLFDEKEVIFRQGEDAERFYMLSSGKILLEQRISEQITISVSTVKPGYSFGWSAMLDDEKYTTEAICVEHCRIFSVRREKIRALLHGDHSLGYIFSQRLLHIIKKRYDIRTEQFIKTIKHHPDLAALL